MKGTGHEGNPEATERETGSVRGGMRAQRGGGREGAGGRGNTQQLSRTDNRPFPRCVAVERPELYLSRPRRVKRPLAGRPRRVERGLQATFTERGLTASPSARPDYATVPVNAATCAAPPADCMAAGQLGLGTGAYRRTPYF